MKGFRLVLFLLLGLLIIGCKSGKRISSSGNLKSKISSEEIIQEHTKKTAKFKTLQSRVKVEYVQGNQTHAHNINLRIEKDKTIWISGALGTVRAKITPTTVGFYNKLDQTYFDGDYRLISDLLGTELDFIKVQNMILGEAIFNLTEDSYDAGVHETSYLLQPKEQNTLLEIFLLLNPGHFKMDSQQLAQPEKRRMLQIDYKNYQEIDKQILPQNIRIIALEEESETIITMDFKSFSLNHELRFPFRIPSGFEEIVIR
jgi:outer membrane biogenesis lipoprotein LolB